MLSILRRVKHRPRNLSFNNKNDSPHNPYGCRQMSYPRRISTPRTAKKKAPATIETTSYESFSTMDSVLALHQDHHQQHQQQQLDLLYNDHHHQQPSSSSSVPSWQTSLLVGQKRQVMKGFLGSLQSATEGLQLLKDSKQPTIVLPIHAFQPWRAHANSLLSASSAVIWDDDDDDDDVHEEDHDDDLTECLSEAKFNSHSAKQTTTVQQAKFHAEAYVEQQQKDDEAEPAHKKETPMEQMDKKEKHMSTFNQVKQDGFNMAKETSLLELSPTVDQRRSFVSLKSRVENALKQCDVQLAISLIPHVRQAQESLHLHCPFKMITSLFYLVVDTKPLAAMSILELLESRPDYSKSRRSIGHYRLLCASVCKFDPNVDSTRQMHIFMQKLVDDISEMDTPNMEVRKELYPILIRAILAQRSPGIGKYAGRLFAFMVEQDFEMKPSWLISLLAESKYSRQSDLPYHEILAKVATDSPRCPAPIPILSSLHNMFPYEDPNVSHVALQSILHLLQREQEEVHATSSFNGTVQGAFKSKYQVDMGTLEALSNSASRSGDSQLILMIWDILERLQRKPNELIYEDSVIALASRRETIGEAFAAMNSMKADGFQVSRALIRSFAERIRSSQHQLNYALQVLVSPQPNNLGKVVSVEGLNVVMSGFAERGDVVGAMDTWQEFHNQRLEPDVESYSFAIEALGKSIRRAKRTDKCGKNMVTEALDSCDRILSLMEQKKIEPTGDVIRGYIELLCLLDEVDTATGIVYDYLSKEKESSDNNHDNHPNAQIRTVLGNKTLYRVAMANASIGNFDTADELASSTSEPISTLHSMIRSKKQRHYRNDYVKRDKSAKR